MNMINKKIFIVGTGRCGTTWIGHWLLQHPKTFGHHETHIVRIMRELLNPGWGQGLKTWLDRDVLLEHIKSFIIDTLGKCKYRSEDEDCLVEHSACHYHDIDLITKLFPDAFFIHPYRDGRNVVKSKIQMAGSLSVADNAIKEWITVMKKMKEKDHRILNIRYESLIEAPARCREITEFLDLEHHKDIDSWRFPVNTPNFTYNPDRWKRLPEDVLAKFEEGEMKELLVELKYVTP